MYIREQSINPEIPDTYMAVAVNDTTFKDAIVGINISDNISRKDLLVACPIIITASVLIIVVIVLCLCGCETKLKKNIHCRAK